MRQLRPGAADPGLFLLCCLLAASPFAAAAVAAADAKVHDIALVPPPPRASGAYGVIGRRDVLPRKLDDYVLDDFYLVSTVGGMLSARDRKTGKERWNIESEDDAVQTINHRANASDVNTDDTLWIVQPSEDGELMFYSQDGLEVCVAGRREGWGLMGAEIKLYGQRHHPADPVHAPRHRHGLQRLQEHDHLCD